MTVEVGGAGSMGLAFEATLGTYVAPTVWVPIRSETLQYVSEPYYRMNLRGQAGRTGVLPGYSHVEGDIEFEVTADEVLRFLYASRMNPSKTGTGPYTYTFTPANVAKTSTGAGASTRKTLSIHVKRGGEVFAYVGCAVGQWTFSVDDSGVLVATVSIVGVNEASQAAASESWPTSTPYGPGKVTVELPSSSARADAATATLTINDNLVAANRLNGTRFAAYCNWGERETTASLEVDFDLRSIDYNPFQSGAIRTLKLVGENNANSDSVTVLYNAVSVDAVPVNLAGLGEVNRYSLNMHGFYNTADEYTITVKSNVNIT